MPSTSPRKQANFQRPGLVFQPEATLGVQRGVNLLIDAIRPTLGPLPRTVCIERLASEKPPELLDSGGVIARRVIQLPRRDEDVGAMFTRQMLYRLHEKVGDGSATAGVIFQSLFNQGVRYLAAGGNPMLLRGYLDQGIALIQSELDRQARPVQGPPSLAQLAEMVCHDPELAENLGEIFDVIGEFGRLEIRNGQGRVVRREFVEGVYWDAGLHSRRMIVDPRQGRTVVEDGAVLATDLEVQEPEDVLHLLELAVQAQLPGVLLVAASLSDQALSLILNESNWRKVKILAVKSPSASLDTLIGDLTDLAILSGGRPVFKATQAKLRHVRPEDFGYARRIWAYAENFGLTAGKGDPRQLRRHVSSLKAAFHLADDLSAREKILQRLGRLLGGSATLWIGAPTEDEYQRKQALAERAANTLRAALLDGVAPGGGTALLACRPALQARLAESADEDEVAAYRMLSRALEEPFRALLANAGYEAGQVLAAMQGLPPGHGCDLRTGKIVDMAAAGLVDPVGVLKEAVHSAIASAGLLLTTDVLVHRRNPPQSLDP